MDAGCRVCTSKYVSLLQSVTVTKTVGPKVWSLRWATLFIVDTAIYFLYRQGYRDPCHPLSTSGYFLQRA